MQIHELNERKVRQKRQAKPAPVTGLDTSKVSPHIAAQIKKAEADAQAKLTQQAAPVQQPAPAQQPATTSSVVGRKPSTWDRVKGAVSSRQAGINQRYDTGQYEKSAAAGNEYQQQIQQQYNTLKSMGTPGFDTKSAATASQTGSRNNNTIPPQVLQQAAKGTYITKTGDYETDKMLQALGYRFK